MLYGNTVQESEYITMNRVRVNKYMFFHTNKQEMFVVCVTNRRGFMDSSKKTFLSCYFSGFFSLLIMCGLWPRNNTFLVSHAGIPYDNDRAQRVYREYRERKSQLVMEEDFALTLAGN